MSNTQATTSRLLKWRLERELSLTHVSDLTGLSRSMLSLIERGLRKPSPMARVKIADRLGVRVADLFDLEPLTDEEVVA